MLYYKWVMMSGVVMTTACKSMGCSHTVFLSLCSSAVAKAFLLIAYGCVGALISFILKKASVSLIISMGYSFMFANLIYTGINQAIRSMGISEKFDIQKYTLVGNTNSLSPDISSEQQIIVLIVCVVAIVASFAISSFIFSKRDV